MRRENDKDNNKIGPLRATLTLKSLTSDDDESIEDESIPGSEIRTEYEFSHPLYLLTLPRKTILQVKHNLFTRVDIDMMHACLIYGDMQDCKVVQGNN